MHKCSNSSTVTPVVIFCFPASYLASSHPNGCEVGVDSFWSRPWQITTVCSSLPHRTHSLLSCCSHSLSLCLLNVAQELVNVGLRLPVKSGRCLFFCILHKAKNCGYNFNGFKKKSEKKFPEMLKKKKKTQFKFHCSWVVIMELVHPRSCMQGPWLFLKGKAKGSDCDRNHMASQT